MLKHELSTILGFMEKQVFLIRRYLGWEIVFMVHTAVNALSIAFIGVSIGNADTTLFLVIGALVWGYLSLLFHEVGEGIAWERWEGTIESTFMAPMRRSIHLGSICLATSIYGIFRTLIVLAVVVFFLHLDLGKADLFAAVVVLLVSSLSFIGMGLFAAILPLFSPEKGGQATHIIQALILLVSGVYYDPSVLPSWMQPISKISPATYTLAGIRRALLEGAGIKELMPILSLLLILGIILIPAGLIGFHIAEQFTRKSGSLSRDG